MRQRKTFVNMLLKRFGVLLLTFLMCCSCIQYPKEKTFQFDYIQGDSTKHIFLNVIEYEQDCYQVISQEYVEEEPDFIIVDFFLY